MIVLILLFELLNKSLKKIFILNQKIIMMIRVLITWFIIDPPFQSTRHFFLSTTTSNFYTRHFYNNKISTQSQEARIVLALQAISKSKKPRITRIAKIYNIPRSTLHDRIKGITSKAETRNTRHNLTQVQEDTLAQYILDLDSRGFLPRIEGVKDMADLLRTMHYEELVGEHWAYNFVRRRPEVKTRFSRAYDFQRALCEDPELINAWFRLVANMRMKYRVQDCDFYNFNETGFIMGVISSNMVVTRVDRRSRGKQL